MFGSAAAPEMAMAVPSDTPLGPPYLSLGRYAPLELRVAKASTARSAAAVERLWLWRSTAPRDLTLVPQCKGLTVNGAALRSCHARWLDDTMLSVRLRIWNGCQSPGQRLGPCAPGFGQSLCIGGSSFGSNPVKESGLRC